MLPQGRLIYVELPYATYGLIVSRHTVVFAPPIARWMVGRKELEVADWLHAKGARTIALGE